MSDPPIYLDIPPGAGGAVAHIVLDRPRKRNALSRAVWEAIPRITAAIEAEPAVKVVILRGAEPVAFSAGADISEFEEVNATEESARAYEATTHRAYDAVARLRRPTIAQVSGVCYGGGCALSLMCDLRYVDETARFCIPPARLGLAYSLKETKRLVDLVGPAKAKEMLMGARVLDAEEALAVGLATRLFPAASLAAETEAFARGLCQLSQYTIRAVKDVCEEIAAGATEDNARTQALALEAFRSPDYAEGRDAFLEKREPRFTYR